MTKSDPDKKNHDITVFTPLPKFSCNVAPFLGSDRQKSLSPRNLFEFSHFSTFPLPPFQFFLQMTANNSRVVWEGAREGGGIFSHTHYSLQPISFIDLWQRATVTLPFLLLGYDIGTQARYKPKTGRYPYRSNKRPTTMTDSESPANNVVNNIVID
jgi:hypothetical protein